jgi:serine/threonine kinase 38
MGPETSKPPKKDQPIPDKNLPFSLSDYVELQTKINLDAFETVSLIGRGTFGKVILVRQKDDGSLYAMKQIRKDIVIKHMQKEHMKAERM